MSKLLSIYLVFVRQIYQLAISLLPINKLRCVNVEINVSYRIVLFSELESCDTINTTKNTMRRLDNA